MARAKNIRSEREQGPATATDGAIGPPITPVDTLSRVLLILTLLAAALIYQRTFNYPFTAWDDPLYVVDNHELGAFGWDEVKTQFGSYVMGNYHPVTMLSYALDIRLSGSDPGAMHRTNVMLHLVNILLVFLLLHRLTGEPRIAVLVTMIFALHPMHVESVAWIAARKDLLMLLFTALSLLFWVAWVRSGKAIAYACALVAFALACLSKAMAVAIVPSLFLVDVLWGRPVRRWAVWREKLAFIALGIVFGLVAIRAQSTMEAITLYRHSLLERCIIALANITWYVGQQFVPLGLNARYGYGPMTDGSIPFSQMVLALVATGLLVSMFRLRPGPNATFGLLFFLVNIALVLQLFPIGSAIRADRYTYVSGIGWALLVIGLLHAPPQRFGPMMKRILLPLVLSYSAILGALSYQRIPVWSSAISLWDDMLAADPGAIDIRLYRAASMRAAHRSDEALADLDSAIAHSPPELTTPYFTRGVLFLERGDYAAALADLDRVYRTGRRPPGLEANLIYAKFKLGHCDEVMARSTEALKNSPDAIDLLNMRAYCSLKAGKAEDARSDLDHSLRLKEDYGDVWYLSALTEFARKDTTRACEHLHKSRLFAMGDPDLRHDRDSLMTRTCH